MTEQRGEYRGRRARWLFALLALAIALCSAACGSDDDDSSAGSGDCPNLAGSWTINMHCGTNLIGTKVTITQDQCQIMTEGSFAGLSGTLAADGSFNLSGTQNGMSVTCGGVATSKSISETCTGDCQVALSR